MVRLEECEYGSFRYKGNPLRKIPPPELRTKLVLLQQTPVMVPGTIRDNLLLPFTLQVNKRAAKPGDASLQEQLERVLLADISLDSSTGGLSSGQQQWVCLVRSLLLQPEVLLLDEPVSALDPESKKVVEAMVEELILEEVTVIMVSHADFYPKLIQVKRIELRDSKLTAKRLRQGEK